MKFIDPRIKHDLDPRIKHDLDAADAKLVDADPDHSNSRLSDVLDLEGFNKNLKKKREHEEFLEKLREYKGPKLEEFEAKTADYYPDIPEPEVDPNKEKPPLEWDENDRTVYRTQVTEEELAKSKIR